MLRMDRDNRRSRWTALGAFVVLGAGIGTLHNRRAAHGQSDVVTTAVRTVTSPFVSAASATGHWFDRNLGWVARGHSLDAENRRLREENGRLREENAKLKEAEITSQRLRSELGFDTRGAARTLAADIISYRPNVDEETMVIARGSRDGVRVKSVVVAPAGLVGQVYNVTPTTADVLLLTDSSSAAGAMVQRAESRARGVCKGNGSSPVSGRGLLTMAYVDSMADIKLRDAVVSSGLGGSQGIFPKGWPIGMVTAVKNDSSGAGRVVTVKPAVDFDRLEEVYVLESDDVVEPPVVRPSPVPRSDRKPRLR